MKVKPLLAIKCAAARKVEAFKAHHVLVRNKQTRLCQGGIIRATQGENGGSYAEELATADLHYRDRAVCHGESSKREG